MKEGILITGSNGFVGKNLLIKIIENGKYDPLKFNRGDSLDFIEQNINQIKLIVHLAAENRSDVQEDFKINNIDLTQNICNLLESKDLKIPIIYTSSIQSVLDNNYGRSKEKCERILETFSKKTGNPVKVLNLSNIFGKWAKPFHNSFIATFCECIANNKPVKVNNRDSVVHLNYIDSIINLIYDYISNKFTGFTLDNVEPEFETTVGEVFDKISFYKRNRAYPSNPQSNDNFNKYLYSTFLTYLDPKMYSYKLQSHNDDRGDFIELYKNMTDSQVSYFTSNIDTIRGKHYHHTKVEKFFIVDGVAEFKFTNINDNSVFRETISHIDNKVIESIPGVAHEIKNVGDVELKVVIWANEVFNEKSPDTFSFM